ncbi:MAG TPA: SpoIIIAH-like family protein [Candidatus Ventrousia excrementavium]|uniref:SpoIIIAH-like family protein n=1 Tax=Candidatus Ventrousia excrementavium TaxID=2840961 RepID=A0A9D1LLZ7_9CLOT|nr:SpoIIIAH-like family protein [Candidatus Ventrousia excrementavium]
MKKKGAIYSVIALMLCVAVYLNWSYNRGDDDFSAASNTDDSKILGQAQLVDGVAQTDEQGKTEDAQESSGFNDGSSEDSYFAEARLSRQKARDEAVSILNVTVENESADEDAKAAATESIQVMAQSAMKESRIENLVIAKGYDECVVFINDNGVNVIVQKPENGLQQEDIARIRDIVISETGVSAEQIKIIETE